MHPSLIADDSHAGVGSRFTERGGAWGRDGHIVYGANFGRALFTVPAAGGIPVPATRLLARRAELSHRFPSFLPDGRYFLYQGRGSTAEGRGVFLASLDGAGEAGQAAETGEESVRILPVVSNALYVPTTDGHVGVLLYVANGRIEAQRFDASRRTLVGSAQPLAIQAGGETLFHPAAVGASSHVARVCDAIRGRQSGFPELIVKEVPRCIMKPKSSVDRDPSQGAETDHAA